MESAREVTEQILAAARCIEAGRRAEAEALCRQILAATPRDPDVLAGLAALARRSGLRGRDATYNP